MLNQNRLSNDMLRFWQHIDRFDGILSGSMPE